MATSGDYNDLINQPIIPSVAGLASEAYVNEKVAAIKVPSLDGYAKTADLATVATSGSYNDLINKPTIPTQYVLPIASDNKLGRSKNRNWY